jgi:PAS domain S-box-containing protein
MFVIELIYNLSFLVALTTIAEYLLRRFEGIEKWRSVMFGTFAGLVILVGMMKPFVLAEGIIFDGRTIILSLVALFYGPWAVAIAAVFAVVYRLLIGGSGVYMAMFFNVLAVVGGLFFYYRNRQKQAIPTRNQLLVLGLGIHVIMMFVLMTLPVVRIYNPLQILGPTIILLYPLVTLILGLILRSNLELKKVEQDLREREEDLSLTLMSIGDGVIATNDQGRITRINPMAQKLTGCTTGCALGKPLNDVFQIRNGQTGALIANPVEMVLQAHQEDELGRNILLAHKDGSAFRIALSTAPIMDSNGQRRGVIFVFSDISEMFEAQSQLLRERMLLRDVMDSLPFSLYIKNLKYEKILVNRTELEMLERPAEEVIGKTDFDLFPKEFAVDYFKDDQQVIEQGQSLLNIIGQMPLSDGSLLWLSSTKVPWKDSDGNILGLIGFGIDITNTIANEEKIRKLSLSVEQSPASVIITDSKGQIEYANPRFEAMTGYSVDKIIGKMPRIFIASEQKPELVSSIWDNILKRGKWEGEYQNKKKSGELYWESITVSPLFDENQNVTNYILIVEDISERKNMLQQLIEAREKAEESDRLKSAFLANMSHEIRTPMNGILGFADLLKDPQLTGDEQALYISVIEQSGQRMLNIINDIIDISKIEAGQIDVFPMPSNVNAMIDYVYSFFLADAQKQGLELRIEKALPDVEARIMTDQNRLTQVLSNLIKNALKFTTQGEISVGYHLIDGDLHFFVSDTGIGIEPQSIKAIFERFAQGNLMLSKRYEGAGLGLSISKALVEKMGGQIWVESEEGKGSTFFFTIPYKRV